MSFSSDDPNGQDSSNFEDEEGLLDLRHYVDIVWKRKWIVLATIVLGVAITIVYTSRQTKIYAASAKLVVDPQAPAVFGTSVQEVVQLGTSNYWSSQEYYNTQLQVIGSYDLARITVTEPFPGSDVRPYQDPRMLPAAVADGLSEDERIEMATAILDGAIGARLVPETRIVEISVHHSDPELARDLANAHARTYETHNLSTRQGSSEDATDFLAPKRDEAAKRLTEAETALLRYRQEHELITRPLQSQVDQTQADLARYSAAVSEARIRRNRVGVIRDRARKAMETDVLKSPIFGLSESGSSAARRLKDQYELERQKFKAVSKELDFKHPDYQRQKEKVDELYALIKAEAELAMSEIEESYRIADETMRKNAADAARAKQLAVALEKPQAEVTRLERLFATAQRDYDKVRGRHHDSELSRENPVGNVRSHEVARTPKFHVFPRFRLNVALAFSLSLLLGLSIAFLLEFLDRTIKSAEDVETAAKVPLLGMIPGLVDIPLTEEALQERDLFVFRNPASRAAECTRSIRTNILFSGADKKLNTLTVSSPNPREGKTMSVMYLGTTMAQSGQRVLLVDTDLRRPRLHKSVGIPRGRGVTNLILGDATYEETIKTTEIPNLWVLPCGPTPPNPAELLLTDRFKEILSDLSDRYDWVILDSPPLNAVTDAVVLGRLSDGVILVVRAGKTLRDDLVRVRRQLGDVDANLLGVILNDLDLSDRKHGYYYYAYGYGENQAEAETS